MVLQYHVRMCSLGRVWFTPVLADEGGIDGYGYTSSLMGCIAGEMGGEVELVLLERLIRRPNEPSTFLHTHNMHGQV